MQLKPTNTEPSVAAKRRFVFFFNGLFWFWKVGGKDDIKTPVEGKKYSLL